MRQPLLTILPAALVAVAFLSFGAIGGEPAPLAGPTNPVVTVDPDDQGQWFASPNGNAKLLKLAEGKNAFFAVISLDPGAAVPFHRDETEEYLLIMEGGGALTLDGHTYDLTEGSVVYMRAGAEVAFLNGPEETIGFQIFAGPKPARKYDTWTSRKDDPEVVFEDVQYFVDTLRTSEKAYMAEWDVFLPAPRCPGPPVGADKRPFAGDCAKAYTDWLYFDVVDTPCEVRIETSPGKYGGDFDIWAECDLDGDGVRAIIHANRADKARLTSPAELR